MTVTSSATVGPPAAKPPNVLGSVSPEQLQTLSTLIATTDFAVIKARPSPASARRLRWPGDRLPVLDPSGQQRIATCEVEVDFGLPLFVALPRPSFPDAPTDRFRLTVDGPTDDVYVIKESNCPWPVAIAR